MVKKKLLGFKRLMKWVGRGRKQSWPNLGYYISTEGVGIACWTAQGSVPVGATRFSLLNSFTDCPSGPPSLLYKGTAALHQGSSGYSMALTTHSHIMLGSMMSRTMHLLPLYACMACLLFPSSDLQRIRKM